MEDLARRVLYEAYGIDTDRYSDEDIYDIIQLLKEELDDRMEEAVDN